MRRLWILLFVGFASFIAALVYLANTGQGGRLSSLFLWIPWHDKIGHFVLMGTLGFLAVVSFSPRLPWRRNVSSWSIIGLVLLVIGAEEWSQQFFPSREFSLYDFLFGAAGVVLLGLLADRLIGPRVTENTRPDS